MGQGDVVLELKRRRPDEDYQASSKPLSEFLPWMEFVTNDVVLCKDGSLVASFEFTGIDAEGVEQIDIDTQASRHDRGVKILGPEMTLWYTHTRKRANDYVSKEEIQNSTARMIDEAWREDFGTRNHYRDRTFLSFVYTPKGGSGRFLDNIGRLMTNGSTPTQALIGSLKLSFSGSDRFMFTVDEIASGIDILNSSADQFWAGMTGMKAQRLSGDKFRGLLQRLASPGSEQENVSVDNNQAYLDSAIGTDTILVHQRHMTFEGVRRKYASVSSIKMWPENGSWPGVFDTLMGADAELVFSLGFQCLDQISAKKYVEDLRRHHENFSKGIVTRLKEVASKEESTNIDNESKIKHKDADDALNDLGAGGTAGYLLSTLVTYGDTLKDMEDGFKDCAERFQEHGFLLMRETMHQLSGWSGILPGQKQRPVRWVFASGANLSDMAPLRSIKTGNRVSEYLSQQRRTETTAVTVLETSSKVPFFFDFYSTDLPHTMVIGPSRMGKSILVMFIVSQFQRYNPQVFIFDKDKTCRIPTVAHQGKYLDLGKEHVPINPLKHIDDKADMDWFVNWVEILLTSRDYTIQAGDDTHIMNALRTVLELKKTVDVSLGDFSNLLPSHLSQQMARWVGDGQFAKYFDNKEDALDLADWTAMAMDDLFSNDTVAQAFLDYAFRRIYKRLDGRPSIIYIEEAWFALKDEKFTAKMDDWLRTLAKKNALLMLATQSLNELAGSKAFTAMVDNIPNRIFLPNPNARASKDLYKGKFNLNDAQLETIRTATPKMDYYFCNPSMSRKINARLPTGILAWLRSDSDAQKMFDEARSLFKDKWMEAYYERVRENK